MPRKKEKPTTPGIIHVEVGGKEYLVNFVDSQKEFKIECRCACCSRNTCLGVNMDYNISAIYYDGGHIGVRNKITLTKIKGIFTKIFPPQPKKYFCLDCWQKELSSAKEKATKLNASLGRLPDTDQD